MFKSGSLQANEDEEWSQVIVINIHTFVFVGKNFDFEKKVKTLMVNNSTNIIKTNNHFLSQTIEHKKDHHV